MSSEHFLKPCDPPGPKGPKPPARESLGGEIKEKHTPAEDFSLKKSSIPPGLGFQC